MNLKDKTVLITGASSGIGMACSEVFAEAGARLILMARRKDRIDELKKRLEKDHDAKVLPLAGDVSDFGLMDKAVRGLPSEWQEIDVLINNAGLARGLNKLQDGEMQDWEEMIDTNIKGLLYVSRLVLPGMVERGRGTVINIGSIAGHQVYPSGNVYCSTKFAVKALTQGMNIDLNGTGVRAASLDPGLVETEFAEVRFRGDKEEAKAVYEGYTPLQGKDIAEAALFIATRPPHVSVHEMIVMPTDQANPYVLNKKEE